MTSWHEWAVIYAVRVLGITEADVRDTRPLHNKDAIEIRLWNRRRLLVDGIDFYQFKWAPKVGIR